MHDAIQIEPQAQTAGPDDDVECLQDTVAVNDPEVLALSMPAVTGVSSAADLSKLFALALDGTILSNTTLERISAPTLDSWHLEKVSRRPVPFACFFSKLPLFRSLSGP